MLSSNAIKDEKVRGDNKGECDWKLWNQMYVYIGCCGKGRLRFLNAIEVSKTCWDKRVAGEKGRNGVNISTFYAKCL